MLYYNISIPLDILKFNIIFFDVYMLYCIISIPVDMLKFNIIFFDIIFFDICML